MALTARRPSEERVLGLIRPVETVRPLPFFGRVIVIVLDIAGVLVAAPSGFGLLWFIPYAGVGTLLVIRRPRNSIGWLLLVLGWGHALATVTLNATVAQFADGSLSIPMRFAGWVLGSGGTLFLLYAILMLVFPSGRLPRSRWAELGRVGIGIGTGFVLASAFGPTINVTLPGYPNGAVVQNPFAIAPDSPIWQVLSIDVTFLPLIVLMVGAAISLVVRFRRASGIERQQLRWMGTSVVIVVAAVLGGLLASAIVPTLADSGVVWIPAILAFPTVPIAIGIAVLRYRLYEIDRIISRTIGWAVTTGSIIAVFGVLVIGLQGLMAPLTRENTLAVAGSTLVAFALFQPLRRRIQSAVDHRFNRSRYDAEQTVGALVAGLRDGANLADIQDRIQATAVRTFRPAGAAVWIRQR
ncbi:MAG TPA: hypothetical protein VFY18_04075 [Candidatus Limnocylindrales bacterium]|nr:hypothetical protein [Candidatus Limnocylindrales bacterium]